MWSTPDCGRVKDWMGCQKLNCGTVRSFSYPLGWLYDIDLESINRHRKTSYHIFGSFHTLKLASWTTSRFGPNRAQMLGVFLNNERNLRFWIRRAPEVFFRGPEYGHFRPFFSSFWISNWPNGLFWTLKCDTYSRVMHVRVKVWYWKASLTSCKVSEFCMKHNYCADLPSRARTLPFPSNVMWTWVKIVDGLHISVSYHL